jgi:arylformamidase
MVILETVFAHYTQNELDRAYDQSILVPNVADYTFRWNEASRQYRQSYPPVTLRYGTGNDEQIDVYPGNPGGPVHFHIHGGAWRSLSRSESGFVAKGLGSKGATVVVAGFSLVPSVTLHTLVDQVRRACLFVRITLQGAERVFISGHSSGAHVALCLLDPDWWQSSGIGPDAIAGAVLSSGPYDLQPVRMSARNNYLKLSEEDAERLTPVRRLGNELPPVSLFWGDGEHDEFKRQSIYLSEQLGNRATATEIAGRNHFDMYSDFGDPGSAIVRTALDQMHKQG